MPAISSPLNGSPHRHGVIAQRTFIWSNTNPTVSPTHWRVLVGNTTYGGSYYTGQKIAAPADRDTNVVLNPSPPNNAIIYAHVEWSYDNGTSWTAASNYNTYVCQP